MKILTGSFDVDQTFGKLQGSSLDSSGFALRFLCPGRSKSPTGGRLPGWTRGGLWARVVFCFLLRSDSGAWHVWSWCWQFKQDALSESNQFNVNPVLRDWDPQTAPWLKVQWIRDQGAYAPKLERFGKGFTSDRLPLKRSNRWKGLQFFFFSFTAGSCRSVSPPGQECQYGALERPKVNGMRWAWVVFECVKPDKNDSTQQDKKYKISTTVDHMIDDAILHENIRKRLYMIYYEQWDGVLTFSELIELSIAHHDI